VLTSGPFLGNESGPITGTGTKPAEADKADSIQADPGGMSRRS